MAAYASGSDDDMSRGGGSPIPRDLFSDDDSDRGRISEAEEDNSLNRREGYGGGGGASASGHASGQAKNSDEEEEEENRRREERKKKEEEKKKKPKGPVRRQMISEDMLTGRNGISKLPDLFKDFTFGGKGRERQDLDKMLSKLEHWIHLLHPKQPFDQCLQRIEFLGGKRKIIKVHLKKIRMGMVDNYDDNDVVVEEDDDEMMNNIDATELAESASAFVSREEDNELVNNDDDEVPLTTSVQISVPLTTRISSDNEFPEDDDDIFGAIDENTIVANSKTVEEMDVDMDDIPQIDDDDDDFISKQIELQMKRAEAADTQSQVKDQVKDKDREASQSDSIDNSDAISTPPTPCDNDDAVQSLSLANPSNSMIETEPNENTETENVSGKLDNETTLVIAETSGDNNEDKADDEDNDGINMDDLEDNDD